MTKPQLLMRFNLLTNQLPSKFPPHFHVDSSLQPNIGGEAKVKEKRDELALSFVNEEQTW